MELKLGVIIQLVLFYCASLCTNVAASPPNDTRLSTNRSSNVFLVGETVSLLCQSNANPAQCTILFYQSSRLLANVTSNSCNASHVVNKIQGCNNETFMCVASNSDGTGPKAYLHVTVQAAPKFKIESVLDNALKTITTGTIAVQENSSLVLNCSATGCPEPNITRWTKQGQAGPLVTGNERILKYNARLTRKDAGNYFCTADNGIVGAPFTSRVLVDVTYKPENTIVSVDKKTFVKGSDKVIVTCRSTANPANCKLFFYQGTTYRASIQTKTCSHSYEYKTIDGCGLLEFSCHAENSVGRERKAVSLTINESPSIDSISIGKVAWKEKVVVMEEHSPLELTCKAIGCPTPNMKWTKSGKTTDLSNGNTLTLVHKFDGGLQKGDAGEYTCTADNKIGKPVSRNIYLNVTYKPVVTLSANSSKLSANQQVNLTCTIDSNPPGMIEWTRNNTVIARGERLILSAEESLPGEYTCHGRNILGSRNKTVVVEVKACDNNKCGNKATCKSKGSTFQCLCTPGFSGQFCQNEDPLREVFRIKFVITSLEWADDYSKPESEKFKALEKKVCDELRKIFERFGWSILNCKVRSFREGSVITETELKLNQSKYQSEVTSNLRNVTKDNKLGEFNLKPSSLQVSAWNICQEKPCKNDGKCVLQGNQGYKCECELFRKGDDCGDGISLAAGIVLIILACIVFLLFIIAIVFVCCQKRRKRTYNTDRQPLGTELVSVKVHDADRPSDHPMAAENEIEVTDDAPIVHSKPEIIVNGTDGQVVNTDDGMTGSYDVNPSPTKNDGKDNITESENQDNVVDVKDDEFLISVDDKVDSHDDKTDPPQDDKESDKEEKPVDRDILKPAECDEVEAANVEEEAFDIHANEESVEDKDKGTEDVKDDEADTGAKDDAEKADKVGETEEEKSSETKDDNTKDEKDEEKATE